MKNTVNKYCPYFKEWQNWMANKSKNAEDIYHNENIFTKISKFPSDDYLSSEDENRE